MTSYLHRARSAVHEFLRGRRDQNTEPAVARPDATPIPVGENLVMVDGVIAFVDAVTAARQTDAWLTTFEVAAARNLQVSDEALAIMATPLGRPATAGLADGERSRFLQLLRPRPGLSRSLAEMERAGVLNVLLPEVTSLRHILLAVQTLEQLLVESTVAGERFGSMLRELQAPELLVLALLLHGASQSTDEHEPARAAEVAEGVGERFALAAAARRTIGFLIRNQFQMSQIALGHDTGDSAVIATFASLVGTEEQLKMLCLMTIADLGSLGSKMLTPWKAEVLWRLFVDTYNQMTIGYGDEVIDNHEAALSTLRTNRPHDISSAEMTAFLEGLPRRYLTLFEPESVYHHVRLWRDIGPDDVHYVLTRKTDVWELTVATLDKPYLFSNICGVLAYLGLDILRGHALTGRSGLVLDVFQFTDHKGCLQRPPLDPLLSDVVAGRVDISTLLQRGADRLPIGSDRQPNPVIYFDNESSPRYTILELVADDAPGLLHGISRVLSRHGCEVDLVLISTEERRAVDVFHLRRGAAKLLDVDQLTLTQDLERLLEPRLDGSSKNDPPTQIR